MTSSISKPICSSSGSLEAATARIGKLSAKQVKALKEHFSGATTPPHWKAIQTFIKENFDISYAQTTINTNRRKWGILSYVRTDHSKVLSVEKIERLKSHFVKYTSPPPYQEIQAYVKDTFKIEISKSMITENRRQWGILTKAPKRFSPSLSKSQIASIEEHFSPRETAPPWKEVQSYIKETYGIEYSYSWIADHIKQWAKSGLVEKNHPKESFEFDQITKEDEDVLSTIIDKEIL